MIDDNTTDKLIEDVEDVATQVASDATVDAEQSCATYEDIDETFLKDGRFKREEFPVLPSMVTSMGRETLAAIVSRYNRSIIEAEELLSDPDRPISAKESAEINSHINRLQEEVAPYAYAQVCLSIGKYGIDTVTDPDLKIAPYIRFGTDDSRKMQGMPPKINVGSAGKNGDAFVSMLSTALGNSVQVKVPLPVSGFTVQIEVPPVPAIIALTSRIDRIEKRLGRLSVGYTFSAQTSEVINEILSTFLHPSRIIKLSVEVPKEDILKYIKQTDIDILLMHFAWLMSPNGYLYTYRCFNTVEQPADDGSDDVKQAPCGHVEEADVNILAMTYYAYNKLSTSQRNRLALASNKLEDVVKYQDEFMNEYLDKHSSFELPISDNVSQNIQNIKVELKIPSIEEHISLSNRWLVKLDNFLNDAGSNRMDDEGANTLVNDISSAMMCSIYLPFVKSITITAVDADGSIRDVTSNNVDTIENSLNSISTIDEVANTFGLRTQTFIEKAQIGFAGIPNKQCPKCKKSQPNEIDGAKLIPINPLRDFFTACHTKIM